MTQLIRPYEGQPLFKQALWPRRRPPSQQKLREALLQLRLLPQGRTERGMERASLRIQEPLLRTPSSQRAHPQPSTLPTNCPCGFAPERSSAGNEGTISIHVPFSMSRLRMAEDKLGRFSEDPERFRKEFTQLVRPFALSWRDLQILLSHGCNP